MNDTTSNERAALLDYASSSNLRNDPLVIDMADMIEEDGERLAAMQEAIANAPHDTANGCRSGWHKTLPNLGMGEALPCTCWKSRV